MYNICHKCGLTRRKLAPEAPDLGDCTCLGQTWFDYEEETRNQEEATVIGVQHYLASIALYLRQAKESNSRNASDFEDLAKQYAKVLDCSSLYKVVRNTE